MKYEWKPWTGGDCPLKRGEIVETFRSDGTRLPPFECGGLSWSHEGHPMILAYRKLTKTEAYRLGAG